MRRIHRPVATPAVSSRLEFTRVGREFRRKPSQPRILRFEPCQPAAAVCVFAISHAAPPPIKDSPRPGDVTLRQVAPM
jgi:hypothetical protein